jgi:hypothetical protein
VPLVAVDPTLPTTVELAFKDIVVIVVVVSFTSDDDVMLEALIVGGWVHFNLVNNVRNSSTLCSFACSSASNSLK